MLEALYWFSFKILNTFIEDHKQSVVFGVRFTKKHKSKKKVAHGPVSKSFGKIVRIMRELVPAIFRMTYGWFLKNDDQLIANTRRPAIYMCFAYEWAFGHITQKEERKMWRSLPLLQDNASLHKIKLSKQKTRTVDKCFCNILHKHCVYIF